ncbi:MAG: hypothetical protein U1E78_01970 [Gammaproteobacteria bacterium]
MLGKSQLEKIISLLVELGILPQQGPASWQVRLSTCHSFIFYQNHLDFVQVKLGMNISLLNEYISLQKAYSIFPEYVPSPYGLFQCGADQLMVTQGVAHQPMARGRHDLSRQEQYQLFEFFTRYNHYFQLSVSVSSMLSLFEETTPYIKSILAEILRYPGIAQHGDLALTNVGHTPSGLVIFDWEDFGGVTFPFYDMTVFLCSFYDFKVDVIFEVLNSKNRMQSFIKEVLKEAGISLLTYKRWIPVHLALFSIMKSKLGYSREIAELSLNASDTAIRQLNNWEKACVI